VSIYPVPGQRMNRKCTQLSNDYPRENEVQGLVESHSDFCTRLWKQVKALLTISRRTRKRPYIV
jgi:hypothetical protein